MLCVLLPPEWLKEEDPSFQPIQADLTTEEIKSLNELGYNAYYYPNYPSQTPQGWVKAEQIDKFEWVFLDLDLKHGAYSSKEDFCNLLLDSELLPTKIVDSGGGIHAYWKVIDLDGMSFLKLSRRLARRFNTDVAVTQLKQLMRIPGTSNTKQKGSPRVCNVVYEGDSTYTCEQLDKWLPNISLEDEEFCKQHYEKAHKINQPTSVDEKLPHKFMKLVKDSQEVRDLYARPQDDRSKADWRLAHIMFAEGFTKDEAMSVLVNCRKALERSPANRISYASNIADKIWEFESSEDKSKVEMSSSVKDILLRGEAIKGTPLPCWKVFDGTEKGFRLTQVLGLVGGSGSGKTTLALNYFYWFTKLNPNYIHLFVSLEQPENEIAERWAKIAHDKPQLHEKVHVLGNYNPDGSYRNLSLSDIEEHVIALEKRLGAKVGCLVIDHIGVLKKKSKEGENQGLIDICHQMKATAKRTNTFLVMQSQTSREKAGIGDLELDKDAAYGTSTFEWYCDYVVTTWQPLKRVYANAPHMTCSAFKYCKIRHKNVMKDNTREDVVHALMFDPKTEILREMTQDESVAFEFWNSQATTLRNKDRKREPTKITKIDWTEGNGEPTAKNHKRQ